MQLILLFLCCDMKLGFCVDSEEVSALQGRSRGLIKSYFLD